MASSNKKSASSKKKTASSKPKSSKKGQVSSNAKERQKISIILIGVAVFLFFVAIIEGQGIWTWFHNKFYALFGFLTVPMTVYMGYATFVYSKGEAGRKSLPTVIGVGALALFLCSVLHIAFHDKDYFAETAYLQQFVDEWQNAPSAKGGGLLGVLVGGGLSALMGKTGAMIVSIIVFICTFLIVSGITLESIACVLKIPLRKVKEITDETIERNAEKREEKREKVAAEKEAAEQERKKFIPPPKPTISADDIDGDGYSDAPSPQNNPEELVISFTPEETPQPEIPVVTLPDNTETPVVEETVEKAVKERKRRAKAPAMPAGVPEKAPAERVFPEAEKEAPQYVLPPLDCLRLAKSDGVADYEAEKELFSKKLLATLESFKIKATITDVIRGPSVTRYEILPDDGIRINKITNLADDIALRLAATSVRIEPISGKSAIGIEVPNSTKSMVSMREAIDSVTFKTASSKLNVALGKNITGEVVCADLAKMPHILVAGTTGSGKSVCLNAMIVSILYNATPDEVKLVMIDPKMVEFSMYNGIAHLEVPVVSNPRKAAGALSWAAAEMDKRYAQFAEFGVRDIKAFNNLCESRTDLKKMPQIVIFIDELADLMMVSPKEVEDSIIRLAQKARAAGIHLVIATQRPSVDVITGLIKANIPSRIALSVSSSTDSRVIIDTIGAEKLLGNGDMLYCPIGSTKSNRVQGCYISDEEVASVVAHIKAQTTTTYNEETIREIESKAAEAENAKKKTVDDGDEGDWDPALEDAIEVVVNAGAASTTMLQKKLKLGYARASRVMDQLQEKGIVGPPEGAKPRAVLITMQQWYEMQALAQGAAPDIDDVFEDDDFEEDEDFAFVEETDGDADDDVGFDDGYFESDEDDDDDFGFVYLEDDGSDSSVF